MLLKRLLFALALAGLATLAGAQDFLRRPSPFAGRSFLTLSLFDEVRAELKTTSETNTQLDGLAESLSGDMQQAFQDANGDFNSVQPKIQEINAKYDDKCLKALSPDQGARLKQLFVQYNGAGSITNPVISTDLGITADQKAQIKKLQDEQRQKMLDTFQSGGSPEDAQPAIKKISDETNVQLDKLLTDDQRTKLKSMEGAKFEFKKITLPIAA